MNQFLLKLYYIIKPLVPRSMQIFLRRQFARYQQKIFSCTWPIDPASAKPPVGWAGWPDGKQFALILSHDVDTRKGYDDVLKLVELEECLGFRSTFNFVPELYGEISLELIEELRDRGFGVGVHGLKHDGKLFFSKRVFNQRAEKINDYLKKWKSRGFSSPSMHHKLDWLKALNIDYSMSTFDTDPFEPQSDGVGTIFPMWMPNESVQEGFLELPYTLPQDSTLFIILQEAKIDIWKKKLDWIAEQGGMALLNTHPDYMNFEFSNYESLKYPVELYAELLENIRIRYCGKYFHSVAKDVAASWREKFMKC